MSTEIATTSYLSGAIIYLLLYLRSLVTTQQKIVNRTISLAAALMFIWFLILTAQVNYQAIHLVVLQSLEILRYAVLYAVLLAILYTAGHQRLNDNKFVQSLILISALNIVLLLIITLLRPVLDSDTLVFITDNTFHMLGLTALSIFGLALVEQVFRNTQQDRRWNVKFICLAAGGIFAYDFFMYSQALLAGEIKEAMLVSRGFSSLFIAPLFFISLSSNPVWQYKLHFSRQVVFHTGTLLISGAYLIIMATAGYFIRIKGGNWGNILQILFFIASILVFIILIMSPQIRAKLSIFVSKHFFRYKYDYRHEWMTITKTLSSLESDENLTLSAIQTISDLVNSPGGALWLKSENNQYQIIDELYCEWEKSNPLIDDQTFIENLKQTEWVIDFNEYQMTPEKYNNIKLPDTLNNLPDAWLLVPLMLHDELIGFIILCAAHIKSELNWEDYDILQVASRQVAGFLAQMQAHEALIKARQFEAYNQMSAFVIHDIKTVVAQLSLMVKNAEAHKNNPSFVEDMIKTTDHSVHKMESLLNQLRQNSTTNETSIFDIKAVLENITAELSSNEPVPELICKQDHLYVLASREHISSAISHIIKNAQEATEQQGYVKIELSRSDNQVIISVKDNGYGMDKIFVKQQLFKPFQSTKGLTGMGIGVYQCRQYLRQAGGDMQVESEPGKGSTFTLSLPLHQQE